MKKIDEKKIIGIWQNLGNKIKVISQSLENVYHKFYIKKKNPI